jgi:two-component system response regulator HydG
LVVEDDPSTQRLLREVLELRGYRVIPKQTAEEALDVLQEHPISLALIDWELPGMNGLELCRQIKRRRAVDPTAVMMVTAKQGAGVLREMLEAGADDYLAKPIDLELLDVRLTILERRVLDLESLQQARDEIVALRRKTARPTTKHGIVGSSPAMQKILTRLELAAKSDVTVMLRGESGTGKELAARTIHDLSARHAGPFVAVNCSAIPDTLLESELFGHVRGAFTGASAAKDGLFHAANGGTLFLDEIGDVDPYIQVKLLRVLQERAVRRVGDHRPTDLDVRIISATNRDLEARVREEKFREDFYYRVNVFELELPPLRDRIEDVPALVDRVLSTLLPARRPDLKGLTRQALDRLMEHDWPGNVRELQNAMEYALVVATGDRIAADDLPDSIASGGRRLRSEPRITQNVQRIVEKQQTEADRVLNALEEAGGVKTKAAEILGISRVALWKKMKKLELEAA